MVPSQHSAVRRALSSYSAPTGLRRRRKDVNGRLLPLALPLLPPPVLPTPLFRVLSHVLPPFSRTPLLVLIPPTGLHPLLSTLSHFLSLSPTRCYVLEAATPAAHARGFPPLSDEILLVELSELGKNGAREKEEDAEGIGEGERKIWGAAFSEKKGGKKKKKRMPSFFLSASSACPLLSPSLPLFPLPSFLSRLLLPPRFAPSFFPNSSYHKSYHFFFALLFFFFIFVFIPHQVKKAFFSCSPVSRSCLKSTSLKNAWLNYPLFSSPKFNSMNLLFA